MASINQLVSEIVHSLGEPNNHALRMNVRNLIYQERNEKIRRSYERNHYLDKIFEQRYRISLINVPDGDIFSSLVSVEYKCKRSEFKVPRPVRLPNNLPFQSIRTVGNNCVEVPFVKQANNRYYARLEGMAKLPTYDYINGYIYVSSNGNTVIDTLSSLIIESAFEKPEQVPVETYDNKYAPSFDLDEDEFLLPEDMIPDIKENIYKRDLLGIRAKTNEVNKVDDSHLTSE